MEWITVAVEGSSFWIEEGKKIVGHVLDETNAMFKVKVDSNNQHDYIEICRLACESINGMCDVVKPYFDNANDAQFFCQNFGLLYSN